jgi:hypothetical protein
MMEKKQPLQQMLLGKVVIHLQKNMIIHVYHPVLVSTQNGSRTFISDLKLVQERAGNTLEVIGVGKDFLNRTPAAQQLRERMDKWDFIKLKSFCTTKEMVSKLKRPHPEWVKIFASCTSKD